MITEDYVSFETAKLLKKKGFDGICQAYYDTHGFSMFNGKGDNYETRPSSILAPTIQMVMKWLRKVHNLCIEPCYVYDGYLCTISKIPTGVEVYYSNEGGDKDSGRFATFEQACEAAILYCLTKLI